MFEDGNVTNCCNKREIYKIETVTNDSTFGQRCLLMWFKVTVYEKQQTTE